jgi:arylsulfatase A-like enzyme
MKVPAMDQSAAALVRDLKRRGLLDETIVVWGGGFKGGLAYGSTDEFGFKAVENRVSIHDVYATMLYALGIDHTKLTYRYAGRDFRLTDVFGEVVKDILV